MKDAKKDTDLTKTAGRGVLYITFAKLWFLLTGYVLIFILPRIFKWSAGGDEQQGQALFGSYKIVFMGISFINNGIITGIIQSVSKFTSENESNADAVKRTALTVQGLFGAAIALAYAGFAKLLADSLGSPDLADLFRLSAAVIVAYSFYAVFIGSFNGKLEFNRQAAFDIAYATVKTVLILGLAAAGLKVFGTVIGFLATSVLFAVAAFMISGLGDKGSFPAGRYFSFAAPLITYTFALNLVMSLDLFLLKGVASRIAADAGKTVLEASEIGKVLAGQYGAAQGLAFIPYQAIISIAFVAFPMISKSTFANDMEKTRSYIRNTLRVSAILTIGLASVFTAIPSQCMGLIFQNEYKVASDSLGILSLGIAAFALTVVSNTILNSAGHVWKSMIVTAVTLSAVIIAVVASIYHVGLGERTLAATAFGTTSGVVIGLIVSAVMVFLRFKAFCPIMTIVRVAFAGTAVILVGRFLLPDAGKIITLAECAAVFFGYLAILAIAGEFKSEDLSQFKRILGKTKK